MVNFDFAEYAHPDRWHDLSEIHYIMCRFPYYIKCKDMGDADRIHTNFDDHFEDQDLFMVCRQFDNFIFFESEEARSLALLLF